MKYINTYEQLATVAICGAKSANVKCNYNRKIFAGSLAEKKTTINLKYCHTIAKRYCCCTDATIAMHMFNRLSVEGGQLANMQRRWYNSYLSTELCGGSIAVAAVKVRDVAQR